MKTKFTTVFLTTLMVICAATVHATVLRVNNTPAITVPYATFQAAYNVAVSGDTIYLEGSGFTYGTLTINKNVTVIGPGYFLSQNPETQANLNPAMADAVYLGNGCSGAKIMGLDVGSIYHNDWSTNLQNIVIRRNRITSQMLVNYSNSYFTNLLFEQNFVSGSATGRYENTVFRNNVISGGVNVYSNYNSISFINNIAGNATITNAPQCANNIFYGATCSFTNCLLSNNICSATQVPSGNGNQLSVDMNSVFVCFTTCTGFSADGRYQLKAGSPAIGAGSNGEDCGIFGGTDPYVLSGIPAIPAIYFFNYNFNNTVINVDMKVKSHN